MTDFYISKRPHALHLADNAQTFMSLFEADTGKGILTYIDSFVSLEMVEQILLVGSIPLRTATAVSDIDLIILIPEGVEPRRFDIDTKILTFRPGDGGLIICGVNALYTGLEVDITFISIDSILKIVHRLQAGNTRLDRQEMLILGRINRSWLLYDKHPGAAERWESSRELVRVYGSTQFYINGLKAMEDAIPAAAYSIFLSLHLSRLAVEQAFFSFFASRGYSGLSDKWIAFLDVYKQNSCRADQKFQSISKQGLELLFSPPPTTLEGTKCYLIAVCTFLGTMQELIIAERSCRLAFKICPQIFDPKRLCKHLILNSI